MAFNPDFFSTEGLREQTLNKMEKTNQEYLAELQRKQEFDKRYADSTKKQQEKMYAEKLKMDKAYLAARKKLEDKAYEASTKKGIAEYKKMTAAQQAEFLKQKKKEREERTREIQELFGAGKIDAQRARQMQAQVDKETLASGKLLLSQFGKETLGNFGKAIDNMTKKLTNAIDSALEDITSYQSRIEARLQGSGESFKNMEKDISKSLAASPYASQKEMYKNLSTLIDKGIAYNVEERAFLQTMTDKIVTTFDAFDSNLLRLVRLQQADITAARMGSEAQLTRVLNSMFKDTAYLSDMHDTVSGAILEANSLLSAKASTSFEYNVQKWLGSLYSLGFSSDAISAIAQGINYLGTGNVSALAGNQALSSLFALSASRGGLDYAKALQKGLEDSDVNKLMYGMISYLQEIASNTDSKIIWSAYSNLFGMSVSDLKAITSLSRGEMDALMKQNMSYAQSINELSRQFGQLSKRMSQGEMINTLVGNLAYTSAGKIASTPAMYATWLITSMIEDATGGTKIPSAFALGTGINLPFTIEGLVKAGIGIGGLLGSIGSIANSLSSAMGGGMAFNPFGWEEELIRGGTIDLLSGGLQTSKSGSRYVGSGATSDITASSLAGATEQAGEVSQITGATAPEHNFDDLYKALFEVGEQRAILVKIDDTIPVRTVMGEYIPGAVKTTDDLYRG